MRIPLKLTSMNHQAWKPGSCHSCRAWPELRESCVRTGLLACSLQRGAMTSHLIQSEWAGHPMRLFLFLKIYIYPAWGRAM